MKLCMIAEEFNYNDIINEMWRKKLSSAHEEFKVYFDNENDDDVTERIITIDQDQWDHTKCQFNCEMRSAGGDWESPVLYFRCQIINGYAKGYSTYTNPHFIFIPNKEQGNNHLIKTKNGWSAPDSEIDETPNERACWESLEKHLTKLVQDEIKIVKSGEKSCDQDAVEKT